MHEIETKCNDTWVYYDSDLLGSFVCGEMAYTAF